MLKLGFRRKMISDFTLEEMQEKSNGYWILFWCYSIASLVVAVVGGFICLDILTELLSINTDGGSKLVLLFGVFSIINFFLILFVWLTNESSYYKMMQLFTEEVRYHREKEMKENRKL